MIQSKVPEANPETDVDLKQAGNPGVALRFANAVACAEFKELLVTQFLRSSRLEHYAPHVKKEGYGCLADLAQAEQAECEMLSKKAGMKAPETVRSRQPRITITLNSWYCKGQYTRFYPLFLVQPVPKF